MQRRLRPKPRRPGEGDPEAALGFLRTTSVDVLFLDIQMPGLTGFELLERLERDVAVVFTTAYDQYALDAFGGTLFVVQIVREDGEEVGAEPPWLLDRAEMAGLEGDGLVAESLDRLPNPDVPEARDRWRMVLSRR